MSCNDRDRMPCGCCQGLGESVLAAPYNRPGLAALAYRIGRHGTFKATMLAAISQQEALGRLGTRRDDDFTIGLIDAWATSLDVLTFYQERFVNEAYLRTAAQRRSILEQSRLIGYRLNPGVAAEVHLAFTIDKDKTEEVTVAAGTRAQSLPVEQDEAPQSFETGGDLVALARWNTLTPRRTALQDFGETTLQFYAAGVATGLQTGDPLLLVPSDGMGGTLTPVLLRIRSVTADAANDRTLIVCHGTGGEAPSAGDDLAETLFVPELTEAEALTGTEVASVASFEAPAPAGRRGRVRRLLAERASRVGALPGDDVYLGYEVMLYADGLGWAIDDLVANIYASRQGAPAGDEGIYALRVSSPLFGHNAPRYKTLLSEWTDGDDAAFPVNWDAPTSIDPEDDTPPPGWPVAFPSGTSGRTAIHLARAHREVVAGSWVVLAGSSGSEVYAQAGVASTAAVAEFSLSSEVTRIELEGETGPYNSSNYTFLATTFSFRDATVHTASEQLSLTEILVAEQVEIMPADTRALQVEEVAHDLEPGRLLILEGELAADDGVHARELLEVAWVEQGDYTRLVFTESTKNAYKLATVVIHANVVAATHGETRSETLGSGDGSQAFQSFRLSQKELTYVSAATTSGGESSLELTVDGVRWHERESLHGAGPRDRVYALNRRDDGYTTVRFGDGKTGARLPTGTENVVAKYRVGIGSEGMVGAEQVSLLATRPLGVKEVVNPLLASGGEDAETRDAARRNAPLTVLTLDRVVSLRDFEDFARAFSGIGKARADWVWNGTERMVHLTVAAPDGENLSDTVRENLEKALDDAREVSRRVMIRECERLYFTVDLRLKVDPDHDWETVTTAVIEAITAAYDFSARDFAQRVADSELIALVQNVAGVLAVDLDALTELFDRVEPDSFGLPANPARYVGDEEPVEGDDEDEDEDPVRPAQLLTLAPVSAEPVKIVEMT